MSARPSRESRRSRRRPKRQGAWIGLQGGRIPCVIWDLSSDGARLAAPRSKKLPDTFTLLTSRDGKSRQFCRVAWRSETQVGIQFIEAPSEAEATHEIVPRARYTPSTNPGSERRPPAHATPLNPQRPIPIHVAGQGQPAAAPVQAGANRATFIRPQHTGDAETAGWASSCAAVFTIKLAIATALFYFAPATSSGYFGWANQVCNRAHGFCVHPEMTGIAALAMAFVFIAVRGMERN